MKERKLYTLYEVREVVIKYLSDSEMNAIVHSILKGSHGFGLCILYCASPKMKTLLIHEDRSYRPNIVYTIESFDSLPKRLANVLNRVYSPYLSF